MATVFTHAFVGGLIAGSTRAEVPRLRLVAFLASLSMLPDLDVFAFSLGIPYAHPLGHRGFFHSLPFALLLAPLAASLAFPRLCRFDPCWWRITAAAFLACASHGVLDAFTDGGRGVGFLIPFDDSRFFSPWRPLVVSPIGVGPFVGRAGTILASELRWVWLPALALAWLWRLSRSLPSRAR